MAPSKGITPHIFSFEVWSWKECQLQMRWRNCKFCVNWQQNKLISKFSLNLWHVSGGIVRVWQAALCIKLFPAEIRCKVRDKSRLNFNIVDMQLNWAAACNTHPATLKQHKMCRPAKKEDGLQYKILRVVYTNGNTVANKPQSNAAQQRSLHQPKQSFSLHLQLLPQLLDCFCSLRLQFLYCCKMFSLQLAFIYFAHTEKVVCSPFSSYKTIHKS